MDNCDRGHPLTGLHLKVLTHLTKDFEKQRTESPLVGNLDKALEVTGKKSGRLHGEAWCICHYGCSRRLIASSINGIAGTAFAKSSAVSSGAFLAISHR